MAETTSESHFYRLGLVKDFPQGERIFIEIDHKPIVIFCLGGEFYATGDICTHDGGAIGEGEIEGDEIICPRHGARFNIRTGDAVSLPAVTGIPVYPIRIVDEFLEIGIPE